MHESKEMDENQRELQQAQINSALGVFLLFFGMVVLIAMAFTQTFVGRLTNLVAGAILGLIGGAMVYRSGRRG